MPTAGLAALDHADAVLGGFTSYIETQPGSEDQQAVSKLIGEAIGGSIWAVIQHAINTRRLSELPLRAPQIAEFTVTPLAG